MNEHVPSEATDDLSPAIVAADDTGMIRGEQLVVAAEIGEQLDSPPEH